MRIPLLIAILAAACGKTEPATPAAPGKEIPDLAARVAEAVGVDRWRDLGRLSFTWRHARGMERRYEWRLPSGEVTVREGTTAKGQTSRTIRAGETPADADAGRAHRMFVNDSYWFLFPLLILDDGSTLRDLGETEVPGLPALGKVRALDVQYAADEGYTGGDRYVLYVGDDDLPVAWAFHKTGAEKPTLVTTRGNRRRVNGLSLPMRFETPDGKLFIEITEATAEPG